MTICSKEDYSSSSSEMSLRYTIGYAFSPNKKTIMTPSFISLCSSLGLHLIPIDPSQPISSQFHLIFHKLYDDLWCSNLEEFSNQNPSVPIIDSIERIKRIQDRVSMLQFVSQLDIHLNEEKQNVSVINNSDHHDYTFGIPNQIAISDPAALDDPATLSGLRFPIIGKPLRADGSTKSHKMALIFNRDGLVKQNFPLVLQEFVNHGGVVFKVYVAGDYVTCVTRKSIPDISDEMFAKLSKEGAVCFSQISNMASGQEQEKHAGVPPESFVNEIAQGLRHEMGLTLFNFDMIKDLRLKNHYLVIDINYFPGYEKLPGYEKVMSDFLWNSVHEEKKRDESSSIVGNGHGNGKVPCDERMEEPKDVE